MPGQRNSRKDFTLKTLGLTLGSRTQSEVIRRCPTFPNVFKEAEAVTGKVILCQYYTMFTEQRDANQFWPLPRNGLSGGEGFTAASIIKKRCG